MYNAAVATDEDDERSDVVHLIPYVFPVQRLVGWYDRLASVDSEEPDIFELDEIVVALQALPPLAGQLGRDLSLIANATEDALQADIIDAIGRLRRLANLEILDLSDNESA